MGLARTVLAFCIVAAVVAASRHAHADDDPEASEKARSLYDRGSERYDARAFPAAARDFLNADGWVPSDAALEMALRAAERSQDVFLVYEVLDRGAGRSLSTALRERMASAEVRASSKVGQVHVECDKPCTFRVDEQPWADKRERVLVGPHRVEIRVEDRLVVRNVDVKPGQALEIAIGAKEVVTAVQVIERPPFSPVWFYVAAGLTVAAAGATTWSAISTKNYHDDYLNTSSRDTRESGVSAQVRTNVLISVTGGLAATTLILALASKPWRSGARATAFRSALVF
jgi:hypothetical protein